MANPPGVLVVDDDEFTRVLLGDALQRLGFVVAGSTATVLEAMELAGSMRPDAALLDLDLGQGPTGIDLAHGLRRLLPTIGIVMLSSYEEPRFVGSNRQPPPGTHYLVKRHISDTGILDAALRAAIDGRTPTPANPHEEVPGSPLSERLLTIMRLVAAGYSNAEIARREFITEASVAKAIARIIRQLDIQATPEQNQRVLIADAYRSLVGAPGRIRG